MNQEVNQMMKKPHRLQPYTMAMAAKHKEEAYGDLRTPISRKIDTHKNN